MPSALLVLESTTFVSLQAHARLPESPSFTSCLLTVLCPCMPVETNGEEKRRRNAKTKEGLGHCSWKDHSSCSSGVSGWDVWYPFSETSEFQSVLITTSATLWDEVGICIFISPSGSFLSNSRDSCTQGRCGLLEFIPAVFSKAPWTNLPVYRRATWKDKQAFVLTTQTQRLGFTTLSHVHVIWLWEEAGTLTPSTQRDSKPGDRTRNLDYHCATWQLPGKEQFLLH